ncbi:MAG: hypothetical protein KGL39_22870 [Patescibacteria group bacterium]|nr:hypothetical protein [Patescibacteria group bacterium]
MKNTLTKHDLLKLNPCKDGLAFAESCGFDFAKIYQTCERGDWLIWLLRKACLLDKPTAVQIAIACAERTLPRLEKKYPDDKRPRQAIEAGQEWLKEPTEENQKKAHAAYAAATAAYASAAYASAAAYAAAAYASAAAAAHAAYASADAAAHAVYAADDAADDARKTERKWQADKIREIIPNPFL